MSSAKENAAKAALEFIRPNMKLGLGTGSTAALFVDLLGKKVAQGLNVICVPTSRATQIQSEKLNIPLTTLDEVGFLDLTIDGADEFDRNKDLIKGGGGALLREKIVASASKKMIVIADESKHVDHLGAFPLPVEIIPFGAQSTTQRIKNCLNNQLGREIEVKLRKNVTGEIFTTDEGNYILDCHCEIIKDAKSLHDELNILTGVVENGLFIRIADQILIGSNHKDVEIL